jgi:hypothetical protein
MPPILLLVVLTFPLLKDTVTLITWVELLPLVNLLWLLRDGWHELALLELLEEQLRAFDLQFLPRQLAEPNEGIFCLDSLLSIGVMSNDPTDFINLGVEGAISGYLLLLGPYLVQEARLLFLHFESFLIESFSIVNKHRGPQNRWWIVGIGVLSRWGPMTSELFHGRGLIGGD